MMTGASEPTLTTSFRPALGVCKFCRSSVEQDEMAAARHLAFRCERVPAELREALLKVPGVVIPQTPQEILKAQAETRRLEHVRHAKREKAKKLSHKKRWVP